MNETLRYSKSFDPNQVTRDGHLDFWFLQQPPGRNDRRLQLEAGINRVAPVVGPDGVRRLPVLLLRSSPWKAGTSETPWHDEFNLDQGHVRYYGDHKATSGVPVGETMGNSQLLSVWNNHGSSRRSDRVQAGPVLIFRGASGLVRGKRTMKGFVEFCGVAVIEQLQYVNQLDPASGDSFPNLVADLAVLRLDTNDTLDWRWIDDRRDPRVTADEALRFAPTTWQAWVDEGKTALPSIRRSL